MANNTGRSTTFEATFPPEGKLDARTMSRIIGTKGCGTKRIVKTVKARFGDETRPFLRANRGDNNFTILAKGSSGEKAVRFIAQFLQKETDFIQGRTSECPHPHQWVDASGYSELMKHIIGKAGCCIKALQEPGGFILNRKKDDAPGKDLFLVEGVDNAQVQRMVVKLREHMEKTRVSQSDGARRRRVQVDLSTPDQTRAQMTVADTNSFGSLMDGDSSEDDSEDSSQGADAEEEIRRHLQSKIHSRGNKARTVGQEMHETRCKLAQTRGVDPRMVSDREVNEHLRELALEEDRELQRVLDAAVGKKQKVDTTSHEEFPDELGSGGIKLQVNELGQWATKSKEVMEKKIAAKPPAPPVAPLKLERQNATRPVPRPTLARSQTGVAPAGSAFDGTPPADNSWPHLDDDTKGWGDSDEEF
tara:strand:- start:4328 stop:5581 length:1254 start_codon:yes stop_codon:yes gene_type:complete